MVDLTHWWSKTMLKPQNKNLGIFLTPTDSRLCRASLTRNKILAALGIFFLEILKLMVSFHWMEESRILVEVVTGAQRGLFPWYRVASKMAEHEVLLSTGRFFTASTRILYIVYTVKTHLFTRSHVVRSQHRPRQCAHLIHTCHPSFVTCYM